MIVVKYHDIAILNRYCTIVHINICFNSSANLFQMDKSLILEICQIVEVKWTVNVVYVVRTGLNWLVWVAVGFNWLCLCAGFARTHGWEGRDWWRRSDGTHPHHTVILILCNCVLIETELSFCIFLTFLSGSTWSSWPQRPLRTPGADGSQGPPGGIGNPGAVGEKVIRISATNKTLFHFN